MGNNLHISYDLHAPDKNYAAVITKIKTLGNWAKVHKSLWYVNSHLTAVEACNAVWSAMDANDSLYVVDSSNNVAAWQNLSGEVAQHVKTEWMK